MGNGPTESRAADNDGEILARQSMAHVAGDDLYLISLFDGSRLRVCLTSWSLGPRAARPNSVTLAGAATLVAPMATKEMRNLSSFMLVDCCSVVLRGYSGMVVGGVS